MNQERYAFQFLTSLDKEINFTSRKTKLLNWNINKQFQSLYSGRDSVIDPKPDKNLVLQHKAGILYKEKGGLIHSLCTSQNCCTVQYNKRFMQERPRNRNNQSLVNWRIKVGMLIQCTGVICSYSLTSTSTETSPKPTCHI